MNNSTHTEITVRDVLVLCLRYLLCLIFPPLAVIDKGCGTMLLVFVCTLFGWLPGTILAFLICLNDKNFFQKKNNNDSNIIITETQSHNANQENKEKEIIDI